MTPRLEFAVLGPLLVRSDGEQLDLGPPKARGLLALLLCDPGKPIATQTLIDELWGEAPPKSAAKNIQLYVHQLRRALGDPERIVRREPGYLVVVGPGELDAHRFAGLAAQGAAETDPARATRVLRTALELWRSEDAFADIRDIPLVRSEARRLAESRVVAVRHRIDADLQLGRHAELVPELVALTGRNPLRERLWARLMTALYRCGRKAEALEAFNEVRRVLAEETGLDPGPELQALQRAILTADPALDLPGGRSLVRPHTLPGDLADFTGRAEELAVLRETLSGERDPDAPVPVVTVSGRGGIGKTTFAVRAAHRASAAYPDGQLFADLHARADPMEVLGRFLRALGVADADVPEDGDERASLYRSVLAGRRVLVVLDNVADEGQVRPLLPGSGTCGVIVTSRPRLGGLPCTRSIDLEGLPDAEGLRLLGAIIGRPRVEAERTAAHRLLQVCAGLPLALRIAGARLVARPHRQVADLADQLGDERDRLDRLRHGDQTVRAGFALGYQALPTRARLLFRLLGRLDAPDFPSWAAAAVLDTSLKEADELLDALVEARLLDGTGSGRYRFHDLIRVFARELAEPGEQAGLRRAFGGWLALTDAAQRAAGAGVYVGETPRWRPEIATAGLRVAAKPVALMLAERSALVRAVEQCASLGLDELCWELALGAMPIFQQGYYVDEWLQVQQRALTACQAAGNRRGEAAMWHLLGSLHAWRRRYAEAGQAHDRALRLFQEIGDRHGTAIVLRHLAVYERIAGNAARSVELAHQAYGLLRELGDGSAAADALHQIGIVHVENGEPETAVPILRQAVEQAQQAGAVLIRSQSSYWLGEAYLALGRPAEAEPAFEVVEEFANAIGGTAASAYVHYARGLLHSARGEPEPARDRLVLALEMSRELRDPLMQVRSLHALAHAYVAVSAVEEARACLDEAMELCVRLDIPLWTARLRDSLGELLVLDHGG